MRRVSLPREVPLRRVRLVCGCEAQELQELADLVVGLRFVSHRACGVDDVATSPADALAGDEAAVHEVSDDSLCRPLGDAHHPCDISEPDVGVARDAKEHLGVIGEESPGLS